MVHDTRHLSKLMVPAEDTNVPSNQSDSFSKRIYIRSDQIRAAWTVEGSILVLLMNLIL